jgi:hypothetical protein
MAETHESTPAFLVFGRFCARRRENPVKLPV